jgi:hypothetical protein
MLSPTINIGVIEIIAHSQIAAICLLNPFNPCSRLVIGEMSPILLITYSTDTESNFIMSGFMGAEKQGITFITRKTFPAARDWDARSLPY